MKTSQLQNFILDAVWSYYIYKDLTNLKEVAGSFWISMIGDPCVYIWITVCAFEELQLYLWGQ